jgi:hypothetical protein
MALFFSDLYVNTVAKGLLQPGEQVLHRVSASHAPWWSMGIPTFQSQYLVLATNQRLVLVKHKKGFFTGDRMESVDTLPWTSVQEVKLGGMFAKKTMRVKGQGSTGQVDLALGVTGGMFEIPKNVDDGKAIAQRFGQMKALPS